MRLHCGGSLGRGQRYGVCRILLAKRGKFDAPKSERQSRGRPQGDPWYPRQTVRTSARTGSLRTRLLKKPWNPRFLAQTSSRAGPYPPANGPKAGRGRSTSANGGRQLQGEDRDCSWALGGLSQARILATTTM